MLIRTRIGVSLDGFVATPDGLPAWDAMPGFGPDSYGIAEFIGQCDAIVIGRTTFDQGFEHWLQSWPYPGKRVYVLTSRPLPEQAFGHLLAEFDVVASEGGPAGLAAQVREAGHTRDVNVLGGARTIQALLDAGALDRLGMVVLPVLLGKGIPLYSIEPTTFSSEAWAASLASPSGPVSRPLFRLERHRTFPDGAIELLYDQGA